MELARNGVRISLSRSGRVRGEGPSCIITVSVQRGERCSILIMSSGRAGLTLLYLCRDWKKTKKKEFRLQAATSSWPL